MDIKEQIAKVIKAETNGDYLEYWREYSLRLTESQQDDYLNKIGGLIIELPDIKEALELLKKTRRMVKQIKKYAAEYVPLRKEVFEQLKTRRGYNSRQPAAEAKSISQMLEEKFTPAQIIQAYDKMKAQSFFRDKNLSMMQVRKDIHEVLKNGTHKEYTEKSGANNSFRASINRPLNSKV